MIVARQNFLTALFADLEANGVRYCILRNYDDLYGNAVSVASRLASQATITRLPTVEPVQPGGAISAGRPE